MLSTIPIKAALSRLSMLRSKTKSYSHRSKLNRSGMKSQSRKWKEL
jgi:hypothetical protein